MNKKGYLIVTMILFWSAHAMGQKIHLFDIRDTSFLNKVMGTKRMVINSGQEIYKKHDTVKLYKTDSSVLVDRLLKKRNQKSQYFIKPGKS